jgi:hypothetical protein
MKSVILLLITLVLSPQAQAQKAIQAKGKVKVNLDYSVRELCDDNCASFSLMTLGFGIPLGLLINEGRTLSKSKTLNTRATLFLAPWGEGKARAGINLKGKKGCADLDMRFDAIAMNESSFELYLPDGSADPIGEMIIFDKEIRAYFDRGIQGRTNGKQDRLCDWYVASDTAVTGKIK